MTTGIGGDRDFVAEVLAEPGGEHLLTCMSCGTCAATCLVHRYEPSFNPRLVLRRAGLGLSQMVLSSSEIWQCSACDLCYPRCPQRIHISGVMRAIRTVAIRQGYAPPGPFPEVDEAKCSGCAVCTRACPYGAIERAAREIDGQERSIAQVDPTLCQRCGLCVAACPSRAISIAMSLAPFSDGELLLRMGAGGWLDRPGWLAGGQGEARILALVCQWSIHADSDWAALDGLQSDDLRIVSLPCSGRVDPAMILLALSRGADGVLVVGCAEGECHYLRGTYQGRGKILLLAQLMQQMGLPAERVAFAESAALDRAVLPRLVRELRTRLEALAQPLPTTAKL
ncbi:MAG: hydrogenase iron-sulfur subunit [Anaerolineales bacterium]